MARNGGEGGIRTHGTLASTPHFECGTFNHSATSPQRTGGTFEAAREVETARNVNAARRPHKTGSGRKNGKPGKA